MSLVFHAPPKQQPIKHDPFVMQDPEGILAAPKGGHISRRQLQKQIVDDKELQAEMEKEREKARAELQARREVSHCLHASQDSRLADGLES